MLSDHATRAFGCTPTHKNVPFRSNGSKPRNGLNGCALKVHTCKRMKCRLRIVRHAGKGGDPASFYASSSRHDLLSKLAQHLIRLPLYAATIMLTFIRTARYLKSCASKNFGASVGNRTPRSTAWKAVARPLRLYTRTVSIKTH